MIHKDKLTFSFGKNWQDFLSVVTEEIVKSMEQSIGEWLTSEQIKDKTILDVGSGSGLSSLCFWRLGCNKLVSFDYDPLSVQATEHLAKTVNSPFNWEIFQGSILDDNLKQKLGRFDLVYSWGVLHHTGSLWKAIDRAMSFVKPGGSILISIYMAGNLYPNHLEIKKRFNNSNESKKKNMIQQEVMRFVKAGNIKNIKEINSSHRERGMSWYYDIVDWLGGLPYEVAWPSDVITFAVDKHFTPLKVFERGQGGCTEYLFKKNTDINNPFIDSFKWSSNSNPEIINRKVIDQVHADFETVMLQNERLYRKINSHRYLLQQLKKLFLSKFV